jgi:PTH2 family peptidyl-tRNA hydrolase
VRRQSSNNLLRILTVKNTKQVIVVRNDLNMRKGKIAAQSCHASMAFLTKGGKVESGRDAYQFFGEPFMEDYKVEINHWLENSFRKICVYVNSEEELYELHQKALNKGLISHIVEDNGATEFNGVKTLTCCAIGPNWDEKFIGITDHLPLL